MKLDYRKLKDEWKQKGEIPDWYSTNALQFFMDKYSYQGETVRSQDIQQNTHLASTLIGGKKMNTHKVKLMNKHSLMLFGTALLFCLHH